MTHDQLLDEDQTVAPRRAGGGRLVMAGLVGACALGAGLGLWARPDGLDRNEATPPPRPEAEADAGGRILQIVVDETPSPLGEPLEVMPAELMALVPPYVPPPEATRSPFALTKVGLPRGVLPVTVLTPPAPPKDASPPRDVKAPPKARPEALARSAAKAPPKAASKAAPKATSAPTSRPTKAARPDHSTRLAKAEPRPKAGEGGKSGTEPVKLATLTKAVKAAPATLKEKAGRIAAPVRAARNDACALPDPAEALVCANPRLNLRDRQLQRAFRDAEAAGVPASALERQRDRWRQARTAAARDGVWAVEDVYEARIAALHDLARDARDD